MANGAFLGGMATGMENAQRLGIAQQGQDTAQKAQALSERAQAFSEKSKTTEQVQKQISETLKAASDIVTAIAESGKDPKQAEGVISPLIESAASLAQRVYGQDGADRVRQQGAALLSRPAAQMKTEHKILTDPITGEQTIVGIGSDNTATAIPINNPPNMNLGGNGNTMTGATVQNIPAGAPAVASSVPASAPGTPISVAPPAAPETAASPFPPTQNKVIQKLVSAGYATEPVIDFKAMRYNLGDTSVVTSAPRGKLGNAERKAVTDRAAEIAMYLNQNPGDVNAKRAMTVAAGQALNQMTKMKYSIKQFEDTAIANGDALVALAQKVDKTGVPVVERWTRAGRQAIAGDTDVSQFNTQMTFYRTEVAKIIVAGNIVGSVLTDDARKEVERALPNSASFEQIKKAHELIKADFARRNKAIDHQIDDIQKSFGQQSGAPAGGPSPDASIAPAPTTKHLIVTPSGGKFTIGP